jgi:hypothetical protein
VLPIATALIVAGMGMTWTVAMVFEILCGR